MNLNVVLVTVVGGWGMGEVDGVRGERREERASTGQGGRRDVKPPSFLLTFGWEMCGGV